MGKIRIQRGDVYLADLSPVIGSEQGGVRPVLIIQNDVGNRYSPTTIVAAITAQLTKSTLPTHVKIKAAESGIAHDSIILLEQLRTIDKRRLKKHLTRFDDRIMKNVDHALHISLNLSFKKIQSLLTGSFFMLNLVLIVGMQVFDFWYFKALAI